MEFVRHRVFSFAQESTRYCNYSKDKFNNELTFILPSWLDDKLIKSWNRSNYIDAYLNNEITPEESIFLSHLIESELNYMTLLKKVNEDKNFDYQSVNSIDFLKNEKLLAWTAQQARQVLPNSLKTELVMTGYVSDWKHFFKLRCDSSAHPDAIALAKPLKDEFIKLNLI